ncbi:MAG: hypothetical protein MI806_34130 [Minwuiales bacterium]|nr:hypothetical protein [Minwuiales bacterium]
MKTYVVAADITSADGNIEETACRAFAARGDAERYFNQVDGAMVDGRQVNGNEQPSAYLMVARLYEVDTGSPLQAVEAVKGHWEVPLTNLGLIVGDRENALLPAPARPAPVPVQQEDPTDAVYALWAQDLKRQIHRLEAEVKSLRQTVQEQASQLSAQSERHHAERQRFARERQEARAELKHKEDRHADEIRRRDVLLQQALAKIERATVRR